jgi:uracil-DNA glycosylase
MSVQIEASWKQQLHEEFEKDYFKSLVHFLKTQKTLGKKIYPRGEHIFNAFAFTPFHQVKVVILGQDPYHQPNQAHGLSFSVQPPTPPPPSLQNIFKELVADVQVPFPTHGNLERWARQGVLLLNASLTVEDSKPMSHSNIGWEHFTDAVIAILNHQQNHLVFVLWGKFAQSKKELITNDTHLVLESSHPSPFSAHKGFLGSKPFSTINNYLVKQEKLPIDWSL